MGDFGLRLLVQFGLGFGFRGGGSGVFGCWVSRTASETNFRRLELILLA